MSDKRIKIDCLDLKSIDEAIALVQRIRSNVSGANLEKLLRALGKEGVSYATARYGSAWYDGVNDVMVSMPEVVVDYGSNSATLTITATGESVLFIEFGTGVYYGDDAEVRSALISGDVVGRGEYGKRRGSRMTWVYRDADGQKVFTHGNPSNACLYDTRKYLESKITTLAKEIFTI